MVVQKENNYAFIDTQNLICGVERLGWLVDFEKLHRYLTDKYRVTKAFLFIGYLESFKNTYVFLEKIGYILCFKPVSDSVDGSIKANIDADLVLRAVLEINNYTGAVIVSGDGDFYSLVAHLKRVSKLRTVLCPDTGKCSYLLRIYAQGYLEGLEGKEKQIGRDGGK